MIRFFTLKILSICDFYYQKKLFSFLKSRGYKNFDVLFDIGAHHGESIKRFLKNFKIKNIYSFEASDKNFSILQKNFIVLTFFKYISTKIGLKLVQIWLFGQNRGVVLHFY